MEFLLDVLVLGFNSVLLPEDRLELLMGLLVGQVPYFLFQRLDLGLGPLSNGSLSFTVICPLLGQLIWSEVGDAAGCGGGSAALLGGAIAGGGAIVDRRLMRRMGGRVERMLGRRSR